MSTQNTSKTEAQSVRERIRSRYGVNRRLAGVPDACPAARCCNGTFVGRYEGDASVFRGIPFAEPPIGALRWKKPVPAPDADAVFEAYYNGKTPIQTEWETERASYYPQGEDCLYLNVWANRACAQDNKPVMVFFHGGAYGWGGTADPLYDGRAFVTAEPDIVLITVGYRVGLMGFVDFSEVPGGEAYPDAPNLGLWDQIEALRWVQKNARAFGGDPDNVTVFGESAGGGSVSLLPFLPAAKGLFRRAIAESGSVALTYAKSECLGFTKKLLKESGAKTMQDLLALSEEDLMRVNKPLNQYNNFPQRDGVLIPLDPYAAYASGETTGVDLMIGTNANEMNYWIGEIGGIVPFRFGIPIKFENDLKRLSAEDRKAAKSFLKNRRGHEIWRMCEFYNELMFRLPAIRQAELHTARGGKAYLYYWTQPSTIPRYGACHAVELAYVFGNTEDTIYTGTPADPDLSRFVMRLWTSFARTGTPDAGELTWNTYDADTRETMVLCTSPHTERDIKGDQRKLLSPMLRYMLNASYAEMDLQVPFVGKVIVKLLGVIAVLGLIALFILYLLPI